jgi:hypothetical protein
MKHSLLISPISMPLFHQYTGSRVSIKHKGIFDRSSFRLETRIKRIIGSFPIAQLSLINLGTSALFGQLEASWITKKQHVFPKHILMCSLSTYWEEMQFWISLELFKFASLKRNHPLVKTIISRALVSSQISIGGDCNTIFFSGLFPSPTEGNGSAHSLHPPFPRASSAMYISATYHIRAINVFISSYIN